MTVVRRATDKDATWARAWTASTFTDLATISGACHGDVAYVTDEARYYAWRDNDSWEPGGILFKQGSFTPALTFGGASTGITYAAAQGQYSQIGNIVFIQCRVNLTNKGTATGTALITGLPIQMTSVQPDGAYSLMVKNMASLNAPMGGVILNTTTASLENFNGTTRVPMTDANFTNTSVVHITAFYRAA